jgi:hypothetical protein
MLVVGFLFQCENIKYNRNIKINITYLKFETVYQ